MELVARQLRARVAAGVVELEAAGRALAVRQRAHRRETGFGLGERGGPGEGLGQRSAGVARDRDVPDALEAAARLAAMEGQQGEIDLVERSLRVLRADGRWQEALEDATELVPGRSACRRWRRGAWHERRELGGDRRDLAPLLDDGVELAGHLRDPSLHDRPRRLGVIDGKVRDPLERVDVEDGCRAHRGIAELVETQLLGADGIDDTRVLAAIPAPLDEQRGDPDERAPRSQRVPRQHRKVGRGAAASWSPTLARVGG